MKNFILILSFIVICTLAFGELTQTKTMESTLFSDLKNACADSLTGGDGSDEVMTFYYNRLKQTRDDEDDWRESRASFEPINQASHYAKESFWGAIGHDTFDEIIYLAELHSVS
jgi:hypothetical protein